jgi:hypothetical protein
MLYELGNSYVDSIKCQRTTCDGHYRLLAERYKRAASAGTLQLFSRKTHR